MKPIQELLNFSIINLDKPTGPTSFWTSQKVKHLLNIKKTAHFGTLDPMVTGVLPIALGRACKLNEVFMHRDKTYVGIMRLHDKVSETKLKASIKKFTGEIMQLPPVKSRVKRQIRPRTVHTFNILEIQGNDVLFESRVQAGTYIRKLCHDVGLDLGIGAHMLELRRTQAGLFDESKNLVNLYDLDSAVKALEDGDEKPLRKILQPAEGLIKEILPIAEANPASKKSLLDGKPIHQADLTSKLPKEEIFALFIEEQFIGIYQQFKEDEILAKAMFVFN
jgi:H/ACA ribonucleoprotein complex subunit 4